MRGTTFAQQHPHKPWNLLEEERDVLEAWINRNEGRPIAIGPPPSQCDVTGFLFAWRSPLSQLEIPRSIHPHLEDRDHVVTNAPRGSEIISRGASFTPLHPHKPGVPLGEECDAFNPGTDRDEDTRHDRFSLDAIRFCGLPIRLEIAIASFETFPSNPRPGPSCSFQLQCLSIIGTPGYIPSPIKAHNVDPLNRSVPVGQSGLAPPCMAAVHPRVASGSQPLPWPLEVVSTASRRK